MATQRETDAVMKTIEAESEAFWKKDFEAWSRCWVHAPYARFMGWWSRGGVRVAEGWEEISTRIGAVMKANPEPNPSATDVRRENINVRVYPEAAWVTFDQYGNDTGDSAMDMPGRSREPRVLEKHDGVWKIAYACWILEEAT